MLHDKCEYVFIVSEKILWKSKNKMQAESGFGSRQFDIGCLDSVIEFGPQSFLPTPKQLGLHVNSAWLQSFSKRKLFALLKFFATNKKAALERMRLVK